MFNKQAGEIEKVSFKKKFLGELDADYRSIVYTATRRPENKFKEYQQSGCGYQLGG